ncbi:diguanylate phosphodiesterase [Marinomonas ushuaiensis DSM 15871]|uniref:Diguanylate phosphodiesterase n=1 Tax=Marinomonas ushuaiensis DSM 15871 TaxID=1122207 RepID=X7E575_9GAMM|nr:EAL domain-containing protein [Marinomonas ushuaiensis]ETX10316.1 diguanylate phosphodiesterase [Marinomonas ushuaiensis DSM 15871]
MASSQHYVKSKKMHYVILAAVFLCGVVTSSTIYLEEYKHISFSQKEEGIYFTEKLNDGLSQQALVLSSIASLISSSKEDVSPEHFTRYLQNLSIQFDAGFYFAQYVPANKKADYEAKQKNILKDDSFAIYPEGDRSGYLALGLGYPDKLSYGYDLLSSEYRYSVTISRARTSLAYVLSEPTNILLSGWESATGTDTFILRMPIYLPIDVRSYKLTDKFGFHGMVGTYFKINDLLKQNGLLKNDQMSYRIADVSDSGSLVWFADSSSKASAWEEGKYDTQKVYFAGREWRVDTRYSADIMSLIHWGSVVWPLVIFGFIALFLFFYMHKLSSAYYLALNLLNKRIETDELTGLASRYQIQQLLTELIKNNQKKDKWVATFVLNLDHFKTINDAFGHEVGDKLLVKVGQRLNSVLPDEAVVGYLGGDAFVVLLANSHEHDVCYLNVLAKEVIQQISQSYFVDGRTLNIGCSIGVAMYPEFGKDAVTLIKNADMAVYKAKTLGRATYHFYDGEMGKQFTRNVRIESRLRQALLHESFELHFQPKVDIMTERCVGMEALLRWNDDELGVVSPVEFIPIAEQTGIILALGEWVFEQAFRHIVEWQEQGICVPPIAINCSAAQLKRADFLPNILALLDKYKIDPSLLEIEVTESILIEDAEGCAELLRQISRLGIKLAIDDFGTGYSSLSYLKDLPFDYIKIDQVFIRDITEDKNHAALTHAIIGLSHNLNLKVIAEGISDVKQLIMLQEFGCDIGQGYLFSKAMGANSMGSDPMIIALNEKDNPN